MLSENILGLSKHKTASISNIQNNLEKSKLEALEAFINESRKGNEKQQEEREKVKYSSAITTFAKGN